MAIENLIDLKTAICDLVDDFGLHLFRQISQLTETIEKSNETITTLSDKVLSYEEEIARLKSEIERLSKPPVITPDSDPITVESPPSVYVAIDGKSFAFSGPGEVNPYSPSERRWYFDYDDEIRVILDANLNGKRRVTFQRAWSDLALEAPVRSVSVQIDDKDNDTHFKQSIRLHHHTRPCVDIGANVLPSVDLALLDFLPNYDFAAIRNNTNTSDWKWRMILSDPTADMISEAYYLANQSWTGGVPLSNEASMLSPWDVYFLSVGGKTTKAADIIGTWNSVGNYAVHFYDRSTGKPCLPESNAAITIPTLSLESLPKLFTVSGTTLPVPDLAHNFGLSNLGALLTHDRYYIEALESFVLLPSLSDSGKVRASGLYWSGQIRSNAWRMRDLFHIYLATKEERFKAQILQHLRYMNDAFANPESKAFLPTGVCSVVQRKPSNWNKYALPTDSETATGNHYFLMYVLGEISQHPEFASHCRPIMSHLAKVVDGVWHHSPSRFVVPWLRHAYPTRTSGWKEIMAATFAKEQLAGLEGFLPPVTKEMACWYRAAVIALIDMADEDEDIFWAQSALKWLDIIAPVDKRPIGWNINPRS
jgi:hypothetical protein